MTMEKYGDKSGTAKATAEAPWVFSLSRDVTKGLDSLESLIKAGFIVTPVQKRSLFILSPGCKAEGRFSNLECIDQEKWNDEDSKKIANPAVSIASAPQRIIDQIRRNGFDLDVFGRIIVFDCGLPDETHGIFLKDISFILGKVKNKTIEVHLFTDQEELPVIFSASAIRKDWKKPAEARSERESGGKDRSVRSSRQSDDVPYNKERRTMYSKKPEKVDMAAMPERIKSCLNQTLSYSHPEELEEIKKLIKKNVPLGRRTYFAAYLLMESGLRFDRRQKDDKPFRDAKSSREEKPFRGKGQRNAQKPADRQERRTQAAPADSKNFYINIGTQDRINISKLAAFVAESCGIKPEDVTGITVKSSYAFFSVSEENAGKVIPALAGKVFGKKIVKVNFANGQKEKQQPGSRQAGSKSERQPRRFSKQGSSGEDKGATAEEPASDLPENPEPETASELAKSSVAVAAVYGASSQHEAPSQYKAPSQDGTSSRDENSSQEESAKTEQKAVAADEPANDAAEPQPVAESEPITESEPVAESEPVTETKSAAGQERNPKQDEDEAPGQLSETEENQ